MNNHDDIDDIFFLIRSGAEKEFSDQLNELNINIVNELGQTLLDEAIACNRNETIKTLIFNGIDVNKQDKKGKAPLHYAATYQHEQAVDLLLGKSDINALDRNNNTPLFDAYISSRKGWGLVKKLINAGADPFILNKAGNSVAKMISEAKVTELMEFINE